MMISNYISVVIFAIIKFNPWQWSKCVSERLFFYCSKLRLKSDMYSGAVSPLTWQFSVYVECDLMAATTIAQLQSVGYKFCHLAIKWTSARLCASLRTCLALDDDGFARTLIDGLPFIHNVNDLRRTFSVICQKRSEKN